MVALNGLAGCVTLIGSESRKDSKERLTALSVGALDRNRLRQAVQKIKLAVKALNDWRKDGRMPPGLVMKVKAARDAALDLFTHLDSGGVSQEIDTRVRAILQSTIHRVEIPREYVSLIWPELQEMGFSEQDPEVRPWLLGFELSEQDKIQLLEVFKSGISKFWEKMIQTIDQIIAQIDQFSSQPHTVSCLSIAIPLCGGSGSGSTGPGVAAYLGCAAAVFSATAVIAILIAACGPLVILCPELSAGAVLTAEGAILGCVAAFTPSS
jgi:hypothetical protein